MVVDDQNWLSECCAYLLLQHLAIPRCGDEDVLPEEAALRLAEDLIEDPAYRDLEPRQAAERFMRDSA